MPDQHEHIDKPEPRWQALLAFLAVGAIYLALPRNLIVGPIWLLPTLIVVLLIPTVISHRAGRRSLNRALGTIINGITTLALIASVLLLVRALPSHKESPLELLRSGALLWLTNVIVFALWYWRLDGGGPTLRHERKEFGSRSFFFPQMQVEGTERERYKIGPWRPAFCRLSARCLHPKFDFRPDRCAIAGALGQSAGHDPGLYFAQHRDPAHLTRRRCLVNGTLHRYNESRIADIAPLNSTLDVSCQSGSDR